MGNMYNAKFGFVARILSYTHGHYSETEFVTKSSLAIARLRNLVVYMCTKMNNCNNWNFKVVVLSRRLINTVLHC